MSLTSLSMLFRVFLALHVDETTSVPHQFKVHIEDGIEDVEDNLVVHCWSRNKDVGTRVLKSNMDFSWTFRDMWWPGKHAVYYCEFHWNNCFQRLQVINTGWESLCSLSDDDTPNTPGCRTYRWWVRPDWVLYGCY